MNKRLNKTQRNYIIMGLCAILVIMGVGYAAFQSQLRISGTSSISSNWNIQITNIETVLPSQFGGTGIPDGYNISEPTYTPTSATFSAGFELPGSEIDYVVEVSNLGNIDGYVTIGNLSCGDNLAIMCGAIAMNKNPIQEEPTNGFQFQNGSQNYSDVSFALKTGEKHYILIGVFYDDVTEQPKDLDASIKLDLTYEQYKDPNAPILSGETTLIGGQEVDLVSGGDGLYEDEYELGRYVYKGTDPNNYIEFNGELWRIISKEADGTYKILRNDILLEEMVFDNIGQRTTGYCSQNYAPEAGCNVWAANKNLIGSPAEFVNGSYKGIIDKDSEMLVYLNGEYLSGIKNNIDKIISHNWGVGAVTYDNNDLTEQIIAEKSYEWNGEIGLINVSDYLRANTNIEQCETESLLSDNYDICKKTNWMYYASSDWWTISPILSNTGYVYRIYSSNGFGSGYGDGTVGTAQSGDSSVKVRPALYLSFEITLTGEGTEANPYVITN